MYSQLWIYFCPILYTFLPHITDEKAKLSTANTINKSKFAFLTWQGLQWCVVIGIVLVLLR